MCAVISPALSLIHPSENIYWTNYNGLPLDFLPVLHMLWQSSQYCVKTSHYSRLWYLLPRMERKGRRESRMEENYDWRTKYRSALQKFVLIEKSTQFGKNDQNKRLLSSFKVHCRKVWYLRLLSERGND